MKKGFTTGSCAAAAGKAAAYMLLSGREKNRITIQTPAGETYCPEIEQISFGEGFVRCGVRKQSGDDPDITNGILVFATVCFAKTKELPDPSERVRILGGEGIGRITRPGLDQPVGEAAINSVPRRMITKEVLEVMSLFDTKEPLCVEISVPEGKALAEKTFNPRLGIEGGISIIGTTGIVEPMSTKALLDTIYVEMRQKKEMGAEVLVISPGNYGLAFMKEHYGFDLDRALKCANYIGKTLDMAKELGFSKILLCGHIGKLVKVSGGIMNTHSGEADCRMELMASAAIRCHGSREAALEILSCVSTEEAISILIREQIDKACFRDLCERIRFYLSRRVSGQIRIECILYSNPYGLLGMTDQAEAFLMEAMNAS